jgi:hypothetical protein
MADLHQNNNHRLRARAATAPALPFRREAEGRLALLAVRVFADAVEGADGK